MRLPLTPHPKWLRDLLEDAESYEARIVGGRLFSEMGSGTLSLSRFKYALVNFYPLVEAFPSYLRNSAGLLRASDGAAGRTARTWLIANRYIERRHASWYRDWAVAFGVPKQTFDRKVTAAATVDAINHYLWHVSVSPSASAAIAAINYGVEGPTGKWARSVLKNIGAYAARDHVDCDEKALRWLSEHVAYDEHHPEEALELIKSLARTPVARAAVAEAMKRSMEYYALAADACYEMGDSERVASRVASSTSSSGGWSASKAAKT